MYLRHFQRSSRFNPGLYLTETDIERIMKYIHRTERKIVSHHSPTVPILMVHGARSEAEKNKSDTPQDIEKDLALHLTPNRKETKIINYNGPPESRQTFEACSKET